MLVATPATARDLQGLDKKDKLLDLLGKAQYYIEGYHVEGNVNFVAENIGA